jgi:hypothetical protein
MNNRIFRVFWQVRGLALAALLAPLSVGAIPSGPISTVDPAFFNALWQFEGNATFASGARIESGLIHLKPCAADQKRGTRGEVSRFQILPAIWRRYSPDRDYANPNSARDVAKKILIDRDRWFREATGHNPSAFDLYVMWNAPGQYEKAGFVRHRLTHPVSERAQRFANLVERTSRERMFTQR